VLAELSPIDTAEPCDELANPYSETTSEVFRPQLESSKVEAVLFAQHGRAHLFSDRVRASANT
jgi:hypothetical protein